MLHADHPAVRKLLLRGCFGLEKESLRVTGDGRMAHTPHPFPEDRHIVRDFCENQTEINTPVCRSAAEAIQKLTEYTVRIQQKLAAQPEREYLWVFSNPPFLKNEEDVPVAQFYGDLASKTEYRHYLSDRYGRYKMTLSGIHVNYSMADELLRSDFELSGEKDFDAYRDRQYLAMAEGMAACGWIMTALTAASPVMDASYVEKGRVDGTAFYGMGSVRCSELGYWNYFTPMLSYEGIREYADSIQYYVDDGLLAFPTELYYPIRLKPAGVNKLETLRESGVNHIELRMVDLNPLTLAGMDERDLVFAQLLMMWVISSPRRPFNRAMQVQAAQNFKNAAHYDLKTVKVAAFGRKPVSVADAGMSLLQEMKAFYHDFPEEIRQVLAFEEAKLIDPENRYAWQIRHAYREGFAKKAMELAIRRQEEALAYPL